uniref:G-protein coupled receptors family 1 profile domain-containing protein n=1 Tax=Ditylenchus dipsaci TaxID=166011 RepID=A0A915D5N9_9BILA
MDEYERYDDYDQIELILPLKGIRQYVAYTYMAVNLLGFLVNAWVLYIVAPVLFLKSAFKMAKVPRSILFYILTLTISDMMTMIAMVFLNLDFVFGTWKFGEWLCTSYLLLDSMNKFIAPIIVFLISRTCYATICLDTKSQEWASSLKMAALQVLISLTFVLIVLWPVFVYSQVFTIYIRANETTKQVTFLKKCSFIPPPKVELMFNVVVSISSYAIPFCGFLYCKLPNTVIKKVIGTVIILAVVYILCWTPYWLGLYAHYFFKINSSSKTEVILMYLVHLMPYVSCAAYPAIFTVMNRAIQSAHAQFIKVQRRRFRNFTFDASKRIREAVSTSEGQSGLHSGVRADSCIAAILQPEISTALSSLRAGSNSFLAARPTTLQKRMTLSCYL